MSLPSKLLSSLPSLILIFCSLLLVYGQEGSDKGSITMVRCDGCGDLLAPPRVEYAGYVGYGPHRYRGEVSVLIVINPTGRVESAKAISGHPYFRSILEKASLRVETQPSEESTKRKAVIVYSITPPIRPSDSIAVVNGRASSLPHPRYPLHARPYCADGKVEVEVTFNRRGQVINARARSGDDLLLKAAIVAAKLARFRTVHEQPRRTVGSLVYDFKCPWRCIKVEVPVNKRALSIPKPELGSIVHRDHLQMVEDETRVDVDIVVSPEGSVISARTRQGHPLIRRALIQSAAGAKFNPTSASQPVYVRAFIRYVIKRSGEVLY